MKISPRRSALFALALLLCAAQFPAQAARYDVSPADPHAADAGPGTLKAPWQTFAKAARTVKAGDTVTLHAGVYREAVEVTASGTPAQPIRFVAAPGEHVVVTGADRITEWHRADDAHPIFWAEWPYKFITWSKNMTHPDDERHVIIGRCEQVWAGGYLLRQVLSRDRMSPGTFFADTDAGRLYVWSDANDDLKDVNVEASTRDSLFHVKGSYVQLKGIQFRYAANHAQQGAVLLEGKGDVMEDCIAERTNAIGATFTAPDITVRRCIFRENGQMGFSAAGAHRLLFTNCLVEDNNVKNFSRGWEAGGDKIVFSRGAVLDHSRFLRNRGVGIWFDIANEDSIVRNCLIKDNEDAGIFYEISYGLHARDNVIAGNGFAESQGAWGAQAGIVLSSSPGGVIERNLFIGNREGFNFREQDRTTPRMGRTGENEVAIWNHDEVIRNNTFAYNRDAQVRGWFDVDDRRFWPAVARGDGRGAKGEVIETVGAGRGDRPADRAADYLAKGDSGLPKDLSLEKLNLQFADNFYHAGPGQGMIHWGVAWKKNVAYPTPAAFGQALKVSRGGAVTDPAFADLYTLDLRIPPAAMKTLKAAYPQGTVPGVTLGALPLSATRKPKP